MMQNLRSNNFEIAMRGNYEHIISKALASRLLVTMPLLFRKERLQLFFQQIRCLSEFFVESIHISVITNANSNEDMAIIKRLLEQFRPSGITYDIQHFWDENDPKALTWAHKRLIRNIFLNKPSHFTHFIYLEDDIRFSYSNFLYFIRNRDRLRKYNFIPSFIRYEFNLNNCDIYATDQIYRRPAHGVGTIYVDYDLFVVPTNPYNAMYILDYELALEYVSSPSFDLNASKMRCAWGSTERSAMGLCFENVPSGYSSRYLVQITNYRSKIHSDCLIHHLPNNFTHRKSSEYYPRFGCLPINDMVDEYCVNHPLDGDVVDWHNGIGLASCAPTHGC